MVNELKKFYTRLGITIVIIFVLILGIFLSTKFIKDRSAINQYIYSGNIDYSVIQKDGTTSEQKLFVSSLVDKIIVKFDYKYNLNKNENVKYKYEIVSSVISNLDDLNEEITEVYRKDTVLTSTEYKLLNTNNIDISEQVDLDFNYYNNLAVEYDKSVNIPIKSKLILKLILYVDNNGNEELYTSYLNLPLEKSTFSINISDGNRKGQIYNTSKNYSKIYINSILIVLIIVCFCIIIYNIIRFLEYKKQHLLEFKYRKIMQDYNNVVVEIPEIPNDKNMTLIRVLYFKSIIDIQKELHVPILCYKNEAYIVYLIISNKLAYVYFLNSNREKI